MSNERRSYSTLMSVLFVESKGRIGDIGPGLAMKGKGTTGANFTFPFIYTQAASFRGGTIVAQGTPEDVAKVKKSYTGRYLKGHMSAVRAVAS